MPILKVGNLLNKQMFCVSTVTNYIDITNLYRKMGQWINRTIKYRKTVKAMKKRAHHSLPLTISTRTTGRVNISTKIFQLKGA